MADLSSYLDYLPPFLWSDENDHEQFLGRMLRIFEKILTGLPDDIVVGRENEAYQPLEKTIDELADLLNPWRVPAAFSPRLASWVALELHPDWNEYQQRKRLAEMVLLYHRRGLKAGLHGYLDIYTLTEAKPRIVIDDGEAIFRANMLDDGTAELRAIAHSQTISFGDPPDTTTITILIHPKAIAVDRQNNYIVVDQGSIETSLAQPTLWKVSSTGSIHYDSVQSVPMPKPIYADTFLKRVTAVVADDQDRYSIIDMGDIRDFGTQDSTIYRFTRSNDEAYERETVIDSSTLTTVRPVDMILDGANNFVVLDRGAHYLGEPPSGAKANTQIVIVREAPLTLETHAVGEVVEPAALVMDSWGRYIIADAKKQFPFREDDEDLFEPADLWRVDPADNWSITSLLGAIPREENPLVFPIGLAFESPNSLLVCDTGVRWGYRSNNPSNRTMAEPAALYRLDLSQTPPTITRITTEQKLVTPTKMVIDRQGNIIITDWGEASSALNRDWRARPHEFGVIVYFSQQRPTMIAERNKLRYDIISVVNQQKPSHSSWWLK